MYGNLNSVVPLLAFTAKKTCANWMSSDKEEQSDVEVRGLEQRIILFGQFRVNTQPRTSF